MRTVMRICQVISILLFVADENVAYCSSIVCRIILYYMACVALMKRLDFVILLDFGIGICNCLRGVRAQEGRLHINGV